MKPMHMKKTVLTVFAAIAAGWACGCTSSITGLFNKDFLNVLGVGEKAATIPGDAPAIVVQVENRTSRTIEALVSYRQGSDSVQQFTTVLPAGLNSGQALICPVTEVTLGDVSNLDRIGALVRLGNGGENDPVIQVEPFGVLLKEGQNFDCGDSLTFTVQPSSETLSGYQTYVYIQRSQN